MLNLAYSLRYLTSTDVRYLRGEYMFLGVVLTDNPIPSGMTAWTAGAGGDPHMTGADIDTSNTANYGEGKDGVIGFFTDDAGRHYFMLVNAWHAANTTAANATLPFYIQFDTSVDELFELDRETGQEIIVPLTNHRLDVTLQGGSGRLYKYNDGAFAPSTGPGPDGGVVDDAGAVSDAGIVGDGSTPPVDGSPGSDAGEGDSDAGTTPDPDGGEGTGESGGGCACRSTSGSSAPSLPLLLLLGLCGLLLRRHRS